MLQSEKVGLMAWSPLAGGLLSGKYGRGIQAEEGNRRTSFDFPPVNLERAYSRSAAQRRNKAADEHVPEPRCGHEGGRRWRLSR